MSCPIKNNEWDRLVKYLGGNETDAYRVFNAHDESLPHIPTITELKQSIGFESTVFSEYKQVKMNNAIERYNKDNGTSHYIKYDVKTPSSVSPKLVLNFMPKTLTIPLSNGNMETTVSVGDVQIQTSKNNERIFKRDGGQYIVYGEIYPTWEDAENALYDSLKVKEGTNIQPSRTFKSKSNSVADVLDNMEKKSKSPYTVILAKRLKGYKTDATIRILSDKQFELAYNEYIKEYGLSNDASLSNGAYLAVTNTILIRSSVSERVILHEISHALTLRALNETTLGEEYDEYFERIKAQLISEGVDPETYGLRNSFEFIAEVFSNPRFIQILQKSKPIDPKRGKSAWQEFKSFLSRIFKTNGDTAYEEALAWSIDVLDANDRIFTVNYSSLDVEALDSEINRLDSVIKALNKSTKKLRAKSAIYSKSADEESTRISFLLNDLSGEVESRIQSNQYSEAILHLIKTISKYELSHMASDAVDYSNGELVLDGAYLNRMDSAIKLYRDILSQITSAYSSNKHDTLLRDIQGNTSEAISKMRSMLNQIEEQVINATRERSVDIMNESLGDELDELNIEAESLFDKIEGDISKFQIWFGNIRESSDPVMRAIYKMIINQHIRTKMASLEVGKDLLTAQEKLEAAGHRDMSVFHERYEGKRTGYLIGRVNWGEYMIEKQRRDDKMLIAMKEFGFQTLAEVPPYRLLTAEQTAVFNSIHVPFRNKYMRDSGPEHGWVPNPPLNKDFDNIKNNELLLEYRNLYANNLNNWKKLLPKVYRKDDASKLLLPQVRKDTLETIKSKDEVIKRLGIRIKESLLTTTDQDEQYGGEVMLDEAGRAARLVPIHYVSKIDNTNDLSDDFTSMGVLFFQMADKFNGISNHLDEIKILQRTLETRTFENGKHGGSFLESNLATMLDNFLSDMVYNEKEKLVEMDIPGTKYKINVTKVSKAILSHVRRVNLFFNIPTTISGYVKGSADATMDKFGRKYTSFESYRWAEIEFDKNLPSLMANIGQRRITGKLNLLMEYNGIRGSINDNFARMNEHNRLLRMSGSDITYFTYTLVDSRIRGKFALSVYDNYRLVDGKFMDKNEFERTYTREGKSPKYDATKQWSDYKDETLYDAYEERDGKFTVKDKYKKYVDEDLKIKVRYIIETRSATLVGQLSEYDRPEMARGILGGFLMLHRNWMVAGVRERFKVDRMNSMTGEMEAGYYRSTYGFVKEFIKKSGGLKEKFAAWHELEDYQKHNVHKTLADGAFLVMCQLMAAFLQSLADDEPDEYWTQYLAFQMNRILLEQKALMSMREAFAMINSPTAASSFLSTISNISNTITNYEEIEYGSYEGMYQWQKVIVKNTIFKNLFELRNVAGIKQRSKFLKTQISNGDSIYSGLFD